MRRFTSRIGVLAATALLALAGTQAAQAAGPTVRAAEDAAYFTLRDATGSDFTVELTDPDRIREAREIVGTGEHKIVIGRIVKRTAAYDPRWSFHCNPDTVSFADQAVEVCDAATPYVEEHLDAAGGAFLPGLYRCPWSGRPTREVTP